MRINGFELYSVNSGSWRTIEVGFQFGAFQTKSDLIVNGNPYWVAMMDENEVLVCFDVTKLAFEIVSLLTLDHDEDAEVELVDWNGCLGALVFSRESERVEYVDVWVFDDVEQIWRKVRTFGPIEMNVYRFLLCLKNGKILGERPDSKLFVFDTETGCVNELFYGARQSEAFEIYGYTESLAYIKGMDKVNVVRGRKRWHS
ncbi:hypothetical protein PHJA_001687500 [Phtheirospermum japonicum]|uniref:F-box associated beta-propeller type 1 domain-containing protein n=1 Tax=Phtheirospermum japonicum TaxID=374723 RepID=A0A830CAY7_9LAMI|nr:hypothetical protein PHJA_001687500 [Phtheirospermum japonicum]